MKAKVNILAKPHPNIFFTHFSGGQIEKQNCVTHPTDCIYLRIAFIALEIFTVL